MLSASSARRPALKCLRGLVRLAIRAVIGIWASVLPAGAPAGRSAVAGNAAARGAARLVLMQSLQRLRRPSALLASALNSLTGLSALHAEQVLLMMVVMLLSSEKRE